MEKNICSKERIVIEWRKEDYFYYSRLNRNEFYCHMQALIYIEIGQ